MNGKQVKRLRKIAREHWERIGRPDNPSVDVLLDRLKKGRHGNANAARKFLVGAAAPQFSGVFYTTKKRSKLTPDAGGELVQESDADAQT